MATTTGALPPPHVVILPSPGMGHLIPLSEFAKILVHRHGFTVTFITVDNSPQVNSFIDSLPAAVTSVPLPTPSLHDLPPEAKVETIVCLTMSRSLPSLRGVVGQLKATTRLVAFVVDLFGAETFDVAREFGIPKYIFYPTNVVVLQLFHHLRELDEATDCEYRDMPESTRLPGCVPVHGRDFLVPLQDRRDPAYSLTLLQTKRYDEAEGIIVNTSVAIEPKAIKEFNRPGLPEWKLHPVGPLIQTGSNPEDRVGCIEWLENQPTGSVLFVSFGSGGTLSLDQLMELAIGLEMSKQRFIWVIRSPSTKRDAMFFTEKSNKVDPIDFLPVGFLERTKGVGLVVRTWAPQISILKHEATGGFLTHCGWNSTLESLVNGVPMIAWPLYAEQKMNAVMLTEEAKVAIRPKAAEVIDRNEISRVVKELMEGEEGKKIRSRVKELQEEMAKGVAVDGSSYMALAEITNEWKNAATVNGMTPIATATAAV